MYIFYRVSFLFCLSILLVSCSSLAKTTSGNENEEMTLIVIANCNEVFVESVTITLSGNKSNWHWVDFSEKIDYREQIAPRLVEQLHLFVSSGEFKRNPTLEGKEEDYTFLFVTPENTKRFGFGYLELKSRLAESPFSAISEIVSGMEASGQFSKGSLFHKLLVCNSSVAQNGEVMREIESAVPSLPNKSSFGQAE